MESTAPDNQRQLRLLDAIPAIVWSASPASFRFTYVNKAAETLLGYPAAEWLEQPAFWADHIHPDDRDVARICYEKVGRLENHELVYRMIARDGRAVWLRDFVSIHSENGVPTELSGVMIDITHEREVEADLRETQERFQRMVEQSPDCIGVHSDNIYVYANEAFVHLLGGTTAADVVGRDVYTVVQQEFHARVAERQARLRAGYSIPYIRERLTRIDGSSVDVEIAAVPLLYEGRKAVQVIARDITATVRAREELAQSEQRYRELVEGITDIVFLVDPGGRFVSLNRSFERITGYSVEEWIGRPFAELFLPDSLPAATEHFEQTLLGIHGAIRQYDIAAKSGAVVNIEVTAQPRFTGGEVTGTIGVARDVTYSRVVERKLEEAKRLSSLGQLAASLAHEFNNVLMGIQPFVELIARRDSGIPIEDAVGHITRSIARGKRASQAILRFASPQDARLGTIDVSAWLPEIVSELTPAVPDTVTLTASIATGVGTILADREHLDQVVSNLIFNARDAVGSAGTISIDVSQAEPGFVGIAVSDDGPGVSPQAREQLFEPLFTTKRNGSGLGLAIARRLMEIQGGTLDLDSSAGPGAVFRLRIPAGEEAPPAESVERSASPAIRRVLLVEDDEAIGEGLEAILSAEGFEVCWSQTFSGALEATGGKRPDVAVVDVNLPDGSGVELIPILRSRFPALPVVLSTGHVEFTFPAESHTVSLLKPYEVTELLDAIQAVCG